MPVRKPVACGKCVFWRNSDGTIVIGTDKPVPAHKLAECRRRLQPGRKTTTPVQPVTPPTDECSEGIPLPLPASLAKNCADCIYWRRTGPDLGNCIVWSPQWADRTENEKRANQRVAQRRFPECPPTFWCGDGVSVDFKDPDELP